VRNDIEFKHSIGTLNWQSNGDCIAVTAESAPFFDAFDSETGRKQAGFMGLGIRPNAYPAVRFYPSKRTIVAGDTDGKLWEWTLHPEWWRDHLKDRRKSVRINSVPRRITVDDEAVASVVRLHDSISYVTTHRSGRVVVANPNQSAARHPRYRDWQNSMIAPERSLWRGPTD